MFFLMTYPIEVRKLHIEPMFARFFNNNQGSILLGLFNDVPECVQNQSLPIKVIEGKNFESWARKETQITPHQIGGTFKISGTKLWRPHTYLSRSRSMTTRTSYLAGKSWSVLDRSSAGACDHHLCTRSTCCNRMSF